MSKKQSADDLVGDQRDIIELAEEGFADDEIAERTGASEGYVRRIRDEYEGEVVVGDTGSRLPLIAKLIVVAVGAYGLYAALTGGV